MAKRGFTLIEVLVALVVMAIGLLALARLNVVYLRATDQAHQISEGVLLAQDKMEDLRKYAIADQPGNYSVFDFDYLTSTTAVFTSVADPPGSGTSKPVAGLLAGAAAPGAALTPTTGGTVYEVLYDDGASSHGDATAGDKVYSNSDTVDTRSQAKGAAGAGTGALIRRVWSVEPITLQTVSGQPVVDYARLTVEAEWVDKQDQPHRVHLESLAHRRQ